MCACMIVARRTNHAVGSSTQGPCSPSDRSSSQKAPSVLAQKQKRCLVISFSSQNVFSFHLGPIC